MQELAKACHSGSSVEHPALALKAQTNLCKTLLPTLLGLLRLVKAEFTIKGGSRRAEKSRKVLMMMKAAKLGFFLIFFNFDPATMSSLLA